MGTIFHFPDLDTLRLAITSGVVPPSVSLVPAVAGSDEQGHIWLQPSAPLPRGLQASLKKLGVQTVKANGALKAETVCCWLQLMPIQHQAAPPTLSNQAPVLFELADTSQLSGLVTEMLRLGNDRQSFRWLQEGSVQRVLLRVIGPPYYSLLRALDREAASASAPVRAYLEQAPRVWVEIGYSHPLAAQIKPADGRLLLMRPPCEWTFLDDAPFQDVYEVLDFTLPGSKQKWADTELKDRLKVPLRLEPGTGQEKAELWVLREAALEQIDDLVRNADDHLLARLAFAVGEHDGLRSIVLRARPSRQDPPVLVLQGQAFRPFLKLPNLFLPCGTRLKPPLRRDAVRKLLADDPGQVTWLYPHQDSSFTPESLPDEAFRPLAEWVDYILDHDRAALQTWIEATRFDFESFICKDDQAARPKPPPTREGRKEGTGDAAPTEFEPMPEPGPRTTRKGRRKQAEDQSADSTRLEPSVLQKRLAELEKQFLDLEGPLDAPERQRLWPELARVNADLDNKADAAICWMNALWEEHEVSREWAESWAGSEAGLLDGDLTSAALGKILENGDPSIADLRHLTACVIAGTHQEPPAAAIVEREADIRQYLQKHEDRLAVRGAWLAWVSLARLSEGDVLGLARARDRLLDRLLTSGLSPEYDLPGFLRFAGQQSNDRFRTVRERITRLRELAHRWNIESYATNVSPRGVLEYTKAYTDLVFAYGLARLGEVNAGRELLGKADSTLRRVDPIHALLLDAYQHRILQALEGKPNTGPLPTEQVVALEGMERFHRYKIDRLRQHSRILEPHEKIDPYRRWKASNDELTRDLTGLPDVSDRGQLADRIRKMLRENPAPEGRVKILVAAMEVSPRVGEAFTVELLGHLAPSLDGLPPLQKSSDLLERATLLERGLFLAAHYDRVEQVQALVGRFVKLVESQRGAGAAQALDSLAGQCFRGLRKLGLRDEIDRLLKEMASLVLQGQDLETVRQRLGKQFSSALRTLLHIAAGWLYFGRTDEALPVLDQASELLFDDSLPNQEKTPLACTYATTLGQAPVDLALQRIEELFRKLGPVNDTFTTNDHYSLSQIDIVESVILAVVSDDFAMGTTARRWLDDDEYLVRRRIHRDLKHLMDRSGL